MNPIEEGGPAEGSPLALDTVTPRSRRAVLAAVAGGAAALVANALGRAAPVRAADGETVLVGGEYIASSKTKFTNTHDYDVALQGVGTTDSIGVAGDSDSGPGVYGASNSDIGVLGISHSSIGVSGDSYSSTKPAMVAHSHASSTGLLGFSGGASLPAAPAKTGVYGYADQDGEANGVIGESVLGIGVRGVSADAIGSLGLATANTGATIGAFGRSNSPAGIGVGGRGYANSTGVVGYSGSGNFPAAQAKTGVYGQATQDSASRGVSGRADAGLGVYGQATSGSGLYGAATTGYALRTSGRIRAEKVSGVASIAAGRTSVIITPGVNVNTGSFVLLTPKANIGSRALWFTIDATNDRFTIRIGSARSSSTRVAWLLLG
jgi:hypothetical protein